MKVENAKKGTVFMKDPRDKRAGYSGQHLIVKSPFDNGLNPIAKGEGAEMENMFGEVHKHEIPRIV